MVSREMIGRRVRVSPWGDEGVVVEWSPLSGGMCDVVIRRDDGSAVAVGSGSCQPVDGRGELPSRGDAQRAARAETVASLEKIRARLIAGWHEKWAGCEHGKAIVGRAIDAALKELRKEQDR